MAMDTAGRSKCGILVTTETRERGRDVLHAAEMLLAAHLHDVLQSLCLCLSLSCNGPCSDRLLLSCTQCPLHNHEQGIVQEKLDQKLHAMDRGQSHKAGNWLASACLWRTPYTPPPLPASWLYQLQIRPELCCVDSLLNQYLDLPGSARLLGKHQ